MVQTILVRRMECHCLWVETYGNLRFLPLL
jgi:hypothetical protein